MKKKLMIPVFGLALVAVACGKESGHTLASVGNPVMANSAPAAPAQALQPQAAADQPVITSDLLSFCQANLGTMSADQLLCKFEIDYNYGKNRIMGTWNSPAYVVQNDTIEIRTAGAPVPVVGNTEFKPGSARLVAQNSGNLSFRGQSTFNPFSVNEIHIRRCFSSRATTVACPN
jgi:hypothetical protein